MKRLRRPAVPLLVTVTALAFVVSGCSMDDKVDKGVQCVVRVDPNSSALDDVNVRVVDPSNCDEDGNGGYYSGPYFISTGGGYYGVPVGTSYIHSSSKDGGSPLIRSNDATGRAAAKIPGKFTGNTVVGRATVKSGGFGSGRTGGGRSGGG